MKLKFHTPQEHVIVSPKLPVIAVNPDNGRISFSTSLVQGIGLKENDRVTFVQDEERPKDWYLVKNAEGFQLKESGQVLAIVNKSIAKAIMDSIGVDSTAKIPVAIKHQDIEGHRLFAVFTKGVEQMKVRKPYKRTPSDET
jgi:hypothetical protein